MATVYIEKRVREAGSLGKGTQNCLARLGDQCGLERSSPREGTAQGHREPRGIIPKPSPGGVGDG